MKSIIRSSLMLGLVSGTLLGPSVFGRSTTVLPSAQAVALTTQEISKQLQPVPVFAITDSQDRPLLATMNGKQKQQVGLFFFSQQEAQAYLNQVKKDKPNLGNSARIKAIGLDKAYELAQRNSKEAVFRFKPAAKQMQAAVKVLQANGNKVQQINGIPAFFAMAGGSQKGYVTIQQGNQQVIPMFLGKEDLDRFLGQLKQQNPKLAATTKVGVGSLEGIVKLMKSQNAPELKQITFVPDQAAVQFVRSQQAPAARR